jgi:2'-5' RNA ligase
MKSYNFSIVAYLTGEDLDFVRDIQKELSEITGSRKCLTDWLPHITLGDGVTVSGDRLAEVEQRILSVVITQKVITAQINGFGGVDNWKGAIPNQITPYVIWLSVEVNQELIDLYNNIKKNITSKEKLWLPETINYSPHITLAFADLNREGYEKGLNYLNGKTLQREFKIEHVALVECSGVGNMTSREYKRFLFN